MKFDKEEKEVVLSVLKNTFDEMTDYGDFSTLDDMNILEGVIKQLEAKPIITTMDSSDIDKLFKAELFGLYERYDKCISSCCMIEVSRLTESLTFDSEGYEVVGIDAVKMILEKGH